MLLDGIFLPVTTPFHADGRLFPAKLAVNVDRYGRTPAAGLLVLGAQGEAEALTDAETRIVLETAMEASAAEQVLLAGVARESVFAAAELTEICAALGYDAAAVRAPLAGSPDLFLDALADRSPLPLVLVSSPGRTLSLALQARLAAHPNVLGVIDAEATPRGVAALMERTTASTREVVVTPTFRAVTGRMLRTARQESELVPAESLRGGATVMTHTPAVGLKTRTKRVGFQVLAAARVELLPCWQAGASGGVPNLGACVPQASCEVWQAFRDGDAALAAEKQERIRAMAELVDREQGIAALKYGCDLNAYFGGRPRLPRLPLTAEQRFAVERLLQGMRN